MDEKEKAGWIVVAGGVLINLMLGVTYTWSVFAGPLMELYKWSQTEVQLAFSIMLAMFAIFTIVGGRIQDRRGPKIVALAGGLLLGAGFVATSLLATTPLMLYLTYGALVGAGVGLAYVTPIAAGVKWFPQRKGLVSGIIVFGFGFGSLVLAPVAKELIVSQGVMQTFLLLGLVFAVAVGAGALLLKNPPEAKSKKGKKADAKDGNYGPMAMMRMPAFWMLWLMFAFAAAAGLMVIGNLATFAKLSFMTEHGMAEDAAFSLAALAVGALAVFNGAGRIFAGWLSDRFGRQKTMLLMFGAQTFLVAGVVFVSGFSPWALFGVMALIGLCFGANFSLFPSACADYFGVKNTGVNYGLLFTSYGVGGIVGPQVMAYLLDSATASAGALSVSAYTLPFLLIGGLVGVAALISLFAKSPHSK